MMFDGVIPLGEALRPLDLSRPSTVRWRQQDFGSRPRRIGVSEGLARAWGGSCGHERVLAELARVPYGQLTTYGTLASIVVVLLWLWLGALAALIGAEVDAQADTQRR